MIPTTGRGPGRGEHRGLDWRQLEIAWPLSLVAGFVGSWLGLAFPLPGASAVVATAVFAPLYAALLGRGRSAAAALVSLAWGIGIMAAAVGSALETSVEPVAARLAFGPFWAEASSAWAEVGWRLAFLALVLLLARPVGGLLALLPLAVGFGVAGVGGAGAACAARDRFDDPLLASLGGLPLFDLIGLVGGLCLCAAVADPRPLRSLGELHPTRRRLLVGGLAAGLAGALLQPWLGPVWALQNPWAG